MMKVKVGISLFACVFVMALSLVGVMPAPAIAEDLGEVLVFINWSSEAEIGALNEIKTRFEAKGGVWKDFAIAHDTGASIPLINMITGGNPPDVFFEANVRNRRDFLKRGLIHDFTEFYNSMNIEDHLPQAGFPVYHTWLDKPHV